MISKDNSAHYSWGDKCDGWHLVKGESLSVIQERMPPGTAEVRHHHKKVRQFFYVLSGELMLEVEGTQHRITAGQGLEISPRKNHQAINASDKPVKFLVISQPTAHGDRVELAPTVSR